MSDVGIGAVLQEARTAMGFGISEAAAATSMRAAQIEAIEADRFEMFGGDVYAKGFIKSYAKYLGVEVEPLLDRYRRFVQHDAMDPLALTAGPISSERVSEVPAWLLRAVAVVGVFALGAGIFQLVGSRVPAAAPDQATVVAPAPAATTESPTPGTGTTAPGAGGVEQAPVASPTPTYDGIELTLAFEGSSWVSVTIDGLASQEGLFSEGDVLDLQGDEEVIVRLGNAGGVRALFNGSGVGPFGGTGEVREIRFTPAGYDEV